MRYSHRNASPDTPTIVGHFWFKGKVNGQDVAEKAAIMRYKGSERLAAIGIEESSKLIDFDGLWWGPIDETPPWEQKSRVWTPLRDGTYEWENSVGDRDVYLRISANGQYLEQWTDDEDKEGIGFGSSGYRLCQSIRED